jgi:hypothetical protein
LLFEVAFQAERLVTFVKQSLIDRAMRRMTHNATFAHRLVFIDERTALRGVTLKTGTVLAKESHPTTMNTPLGHARGATLHGIALVGLMTVGATHLSFQDRVMMRQLKIPSDIEVTLQAGLRRFPRINDQVRRAATLRMKTSRAVT